MQLRLLICLLLSTLVASKELVPRKPAQSKLGAGTSGRSKLIWSTVTSYGAGDTFKSGNCVAQKVACGKKKKKGHHYAAISQNIFGKGPNEGAGPACGTCWLLIPQEEKYNAFVVEVDDLCPAQGNPLCAQKTLADKNSERMNANVDLCRDDGGALKYFGTKKEAMSHARITQVDCKWAGKPLAPLFRELGLEPQALKKTKNQAARG